MTTSILRAQGGRRSLPRTGILLFAVSSLALSACESSRSLFKALTGPLEETGSGAPKATAIAQPKGTAQPKGSPAAKPSPDRRIFAASVTAAPFVMADAKARPEQRDGAWQDTLAGVGAGAGSGPTPTPTPSPTLASPAGYWVQIAARKERRLSERAWSRLVARHGPLLSTERHVIRRAAFDDGRVFYRLQLGPYETRRGADSKCIALRAARLGCFLVASSGRIFLPKRTVTPAVITKRVKRPAKTVRAAARGTRLPSKPLAKPLAKPSAKPASKLVSGPAAKPEPNPLTKRRPRNDPLFLKSTRIPGMPE